MLNVGFSELLLIVVAAILLIRPKDYPTVIRAVAKLVNEVRTLVHGVKAQVDTMMKDSGLHEFRQQGTGTITDLYGKEQETYDITDLLPPSKKEGE